MVQLTKVGGTLTHGKATKAHDAPPDKRYYSQDVTTQSSGLCNNYLSHHTIGIYGFSSRQKPFLGGCVP